MPDASRELITLLVKERSDLLRGDFPALREAAAAIENLSEKLTATKDVQSLTRVKDLAHANAALITAALRGVQAAQKRLTEISGLAPATGTYAPDGTAVPHGRDRVAFERRL